MRWNEEENFQDWYRPDTPRKMISAQDQTIQGANLFTSNVMINRLYEAGIH